MTQKFCPKCGKLESNPLTNNLCKECSSKSTPLLISFKKPKIILCSSCNSYLYKNTWHKALDEDIKKNIQQIISKIFGEKLHLNPEAKIIKIISLLPKKFHFKKGNILNFDVEINLEDKNKKESKIVPFQIKFSICNLCKKVSSNYYEAILQLHPKEKKLSDFVKKTIEFKKDVFITKQVILKHGYDLYITSQKYAKQLASILNKKFKGEVKITHTLYGRKEGKNVYRATVLFRLKK